MVLLSPQAPFLGGLCVPGHVGGASYQSPCRSSRICHRNALTEKAWVRRRAGAERKTSSEVRLFLSVKLHEEQLKSNFTV